jgi:adenosylhomocysteine nucleosidase
MKRLFVAALKEETPDLNFFNHTGAGKVNAAYHVSKLIFQNKPLEIINFGTAGSLKKGLKGLIECTKFYQRDMDARGLNFELGETPFDEIKEIILSENGHSCGSGDSFVTSKIEMQVDVVDMEAYAIAKICKKENIKFRCFKFISDEANKNAKSDWIENCKKGATLFEELAKKLSLI